jgi:nitrite reductase (NO-forming)
MSASKSALRTVLSTIGLGVFMNMAVYAAGPSKEALMKRGGEVYNEYCKTCHQATGQGLANVYPPLAGSDYIKSKDKKTIIDNVTNGLKGEITVNGKKYNNVMTALPAKYNDADAAAAITYILNSWGNNGGVVSEAEVKKIRKAAKK